VVLQVDTNASEEHTAAIFVAEVFWSEVTKFLCTFSYQFSFLQLAVNELYELVYCCTAIVL
jgi:hypothetical protein